MTNEVVAACEGAIAAGATEILIKDAHATGRNIIASRLPDCARLIRGWSGHPLCMVQELDDSFDAVVLVGYHSKAGSEGNPLAHTLTVKIAQLRLNGEVASEFLLHSPRRRAVRRAGRLRLRRPRTSAARCRCSIRRSRRWRSAKASGRRPSASRRRWPSAASARAWPRRCGGDLAACRVPLPDRFTLEIVYNNPVDAYRASWYPGMQHPAPQTVRFDTSRLLRGAARHPLRRAVSRVAAQPGNRPAGSSVNSSWARPTPRSA